MRLTVRRLDSDDIFHDRVRIPRRYREGIPEATICKLLTGRTSKIVDVYGDPDTQTAAVFMDARTRKHFGLNAGDKANFQLAPVGWWGQIRWAASHADAAQRIAAQLGIISLVLGGLSLALGVLAIFLAK